MMACVLADHFLRHRGQVGSEPKANSLEQDKTPLQLSVDVKGRIFINDTEVAMDELTQKLKAITDARRGG
jgi:biopolymer transport protein TolR